MLLESNTRCIVSISLAAVARRLYVNASEWQIKASDSESDRKRPDSESLDERLDEIIAYGSNPEAGVFANGKGQATMRQNTSCSICRRISLWRDGQNPYVIHEFPNSLFIVGDHQYHKGYSLLLLKDHVRELHELEPAVQVALFQELMTAGRAVASAFKPWKMNYSCYGNLDPHIHWHLFPRYDSEPDHLNHPWLHASEFKDHLIDPQTARELGEKIRANLIAP